MPDPQTTFDLIQTSGLIGLLIVLAFPTLRKQFGFETDHTDAIAAALKAAIADENKSPILVKSQIERICDDIREIRKRQTENLARQGEIAENLAFIKGKLAVHE